MREYEEVSSSSSMGGDGFDIAGHDYYLRKGLWMV